MALVYSSRSGRATVASVAQQASLKRAVFEDEPGVNRMLYLPRALTAQQLPEAAALVAVDDARGRRLGTIVVSVADEVFRRTTLGMCGRPS